VRRTNLALLLALGLAFASGVLALLVSVGNAGIVVFAHGAAGLAVVALVRWKAPIARRGIRRARPDRALALLLAGLAVATLVTGVVHVLGLGDAGPLTTLGWHIGLAVALVPLVVLHLVARPQRPRRGDLTRVAFLRLAGLTALAAGAKLALDAVAAPRAATGSLRRDRPAPTSWLDDSAPSRPTSWDARLAGLPVHEVVASLDCTSGWYAVSRWSGVRVADVLGPLPAGTSSIVVQSDTGYSRRFAASDVPGLLLATHMDGEPLPRDNGGPLRLVAPGRRGFWWVKWVRSVEPSDRPSWWQSPFPLQ
jgi:hypothetical protein